VTMKSTEFWVVTLCSLEKPNVSEEHITSIFGSQNKCARPVVSSLAYSLTMKMEVPLEHQALLAYKALLYSLNLEDCGLLSYICCIIY
jgi:hypothetical protein